MLFACGPSVKFDKIEVMFIRRRFYTSVRTAEGHINDSQAYSEQPSVLIVDVRAQDARWR